jgi:ankyrin repeat protein
MHWALTGRGTAMLDHLLRRGSPIDVRSAEGATPLMNAVQDGDLDRATFLLDHGADPNAIDLRGFAALHRAAESGHKGLVELLLARGAAANVVAEGHTALSLAEQRGRAEICALLRGR